MKSILREILIHTVALYLVIISIPGVSFDGNLRSLTSLSILHTGGAILALFFHFVRPVLKLILLPINLLTLGIFSGLINVLILYLFTRFFGQLKIVEWTFVRMEYQGFTIPELKISVFWTYVLASVIISLVISFFRWLFD